MQYRSWIAGFLRNLGAVAAGLAAGALVSFGIVRYAQFVDEDAASIMAAVFPALIGGYVAGRIARRWSPLWGFLVAVPLALYWACTTADAGPVEMELLSVPASGVAGGGIAAAFRSPRARRIVGRSMALVIAMYAIWCIPPIIATARNYRIFETTVFPQIVREVDYGVIDLSGKPTVRVFPTHLIYDDSEPGWVRFAGRAGEAKIDGWLDKRGKWILEFDVRLEPNPRKLRKIDDLESARAYARSIGMKEGVVPRLRREYAQQGQYTDAFGAALMLGDQLPFSEHPAISYVSVYRDGVIEISAGMECY